MKTLTTRARGTRKALAELYPGKCAPLDSRGAWQCCKCRDWNEGNRPNCFGCDHIRCNAPTDDGESSETRTLLVSQAEAEDHTCPFCGTEMDCIVEHERDSSNDHIDCPKCGWTYSEVETWRL